MGEFADMAVDQALNGDYWDWASEDERDIDDWGPGTAFRRTTGPRPKTCRCCGTKDLYWGQVDGRWLLHDYEEDEDGEFEKVPHICKFKGFGKK